MYRSPFELRSRKPQQTNNILKSNNKENQIQKILPSTIKTKSVLKPSIENNKVHDVTVQLKEINERITSQQKFIQDTVQTIRKDIDDKSTQFGLITNSIRVDFDHNVNAMRAQFNHYGTTKTQMR